MNRRALLSTIGTGALLAGCVGSVPGLTSRDDGVTVTDVTRHQGAIPTYDVRADKATENDDKLPKIQFSDMPDVAQLEFVNAVARPSYFPWDSAILSNALHRNTVHFRGEQFRTGVGVADYFTALPEGWDSPVELTAERTDDEVRLRLENTSDGPVALRYPESPPFGVLVAGAPSNSAFLSHEEYHTNDRIVVYDEVVYTDHFTPSAFEELPPGPDEAVQSTYSVPGEVTKNHTIRLQIELLLDPEGTYKRHSVVEWELSDLA